MTFEVDSTNVRKIFHITFLLKVPENADHLITEHSKRFSQQVFLEATIWASLSKCLSELCWKTTTASHSLKISKKVLKITKMEERFSC